MGYGRNGPVGDIAGRIPFRLRKYVTMCVEIKILCYRLNTCSLSLCSVVYRRAIHVLNWVGSIQSEEFLGEMHCPAP